MRKWYVLAILSSSEDRLFRTVDLFCLTQVQSGRRVENKFTVGCFVLQYSKPPARRGQEKRKGVPFATPGPDFPTDYRYSTREGSSYSTAPRWVNRDDLLGRLSPLVDDFLHDPTSFMSGFENCPSAPTASPLCSNLSVIREEKRTTGSILNSGSSLMRLQRW